MAGRPKGTTGIPRRSSVATKAKIQARKELADKDLMLAALAETVDEFLSKEDTSTDQKAESVKLKDVGNTK